MKNYLPFTALLCILFLSGCAPQVSGFSYAGGQLPAKKNCGTPGNMPACQDAQYKDNAVMTITLNPAQVVVNPKTVCVKKNGTITANINFAGQPEKKNTVRTVPKDLADLWVFGINSSDAKKITIDVDGSVDSGDYYYGVATSIAGCIDPRISVQ